MDLKGLGYAHCSSRMLDLMKLFIGASRNTAPTFFRTLSYLLRYYFLRLFLACAIIIPTGLDNTCYPETLGKMLVINAPYLAVQTWGLVSRWLDKRTLEKIEVQQLSVQYSCF